MFLRGPELLAANNEEPVDLRAPRLQQNIQPAHVPKSMCLVYPNRRAIEEIDIATLELRIFAGFHVCHAPIFREFALSGQSP
jgi:hypothetical protein